MIDRVFSALIGLTLIGLLASDPAAAQSTPRSDHECLIQPREVVAIASPVQGIIERVAVDRGDLVREGTILVTLESSMERAAVAVARARAEQRSGLMSAQTRLDFGIRRYDRTVDMFKKDLVPIKEMDEAETAKVLAEHGLLEAQENERIAKLELERAQAALALRTIRSPLTGVVTERTQAPGELATDKGPVLKLARIDPLLVEVFVPVSMLGRIRTGMKADVTPEAPVNTPREAAVTVVDRVVDAASGTFGVRLELPNPDNQLPGGLKCRVRFPRRAERCHGPRAGEGPRKRGARRSVPRRARSSEGRSSRETRRELRRVTSGPRRGGRARGSPEPARAACAPRSSALRSSRR